MKYFWKHSLITFFPIPFSEISFTESIAKGNKQTELIEYSFLGISDRTGETSPRPSAHSKDDQEHFPGKICFHHEQANYSLKTFAK